MDDNKIILIIDDDERVVKMLIRRLKRMKFSIHTAVNGKLGFEKALILQPDLVLLDIQMPIMDGYTTIVKLREVGYTGLVVACTASVRAQDTKKAIEKGCDYFIAKPIDRDFEETIQKLLNKNIEELRDEQSKSK
jgi:two-component system cell cycle response regulator DivK